MTVFPDEIFILSNGLSTIDCPPQYGWASSELFRVWIKQKVEKGGIHSFFPYTTIEPGPVISSSVALRLGNLYYWLFWFSGSFSRTTGSIPLGNPNPIFKCHQLSQQCLPWLLPCPLNLGSNLRSCFEVSYGFLFSFHM